MPWPVVPALIDAITRTLCLWWILFKFETPWILLRVSLIFGGFMEFALRSDGNHAVASKLLQIHALARHRQASSTAQVKPFHHSTRQSSGQDAVTGAHSHKLQATLLGFLP